MKNDSQWFERYFVPGQREYIRNRRIKAFLTGFVIAAFLFTSLGYGWRMKQTENNLMEITTKYENARNRVADLEAKLGVMHGKNKKKTFNR